MGGQLPVLVVDDQEAFRAAARAVIDRLDGFELVGEASSGADAIKAVAETRPALVLMDIKMPEMSGIEATRRILAIHPRTVVVLCSTYASGDLPSDASTCGARAYLHKEQLSMDTLRRIWDERGQSPCEIT